MKTKIIFFIALCITFMVNAKTFAVDGLKYEVTLTTPKQVAIIGGTPVTINLLS